MERRAVNLDNEVADILNDAIEIARENNSEFISTAHFMYSLLMREIQIGNDSSILKDFESRTGLDAEVIVGSLLDRIKEDSVDYMPEPIPGADLGNVLAESAFSTNKVVTVMEIYNRIMKTRGTEFMEVLTRYNEYYLEDEVDREEDDLISTFCIDLGSRVPVEIDNNKEVDKAIDEMVKVLCRKDKRNVGLLGDVGIDKTYLLSILANRLNSDAVPEFIRGKKVYKLNVLKGLCNVRNNAEFSDLTCDIARILVDRNAILVIDDLMPFISVASGSIVPTLVIDNKLQLIFTSTKEKYKSLSAKLFSSKFKLISLDEEDLTYNMGVIKDNIEEYTSYHDIQVSENGIKKALELSKNSGTNKIAERALDIIDNAMGLAHVKGVDVIGEDDIAESVEVKSIKSNVKDFSKLKTLKDNIAKNIIGQDSAIEDVVRAIKRNRVGIRKGNRPIGSFLFVGPTGVGKTELTKVLGKELYEDEGSVIRFDMSEYMEKHAVSKLIGAPPGYVGFDEDGQLSSRVRENPNSIVLFDEIEKAHPDISNILLQILDDGILTDNKGRKINFKDTVIILTSNIGCSHKVSSGIGFNKEEKDKLKDNIQEGLEMFFRPEFINRLDKVAEFNRLGKEDIRKIIRIMLNEITESLKEQDINISFTDKVVDFISKEGFSDKFGARNVRRKIQTTLEDYIADAIIEESIKSGDSVEIDIKRNKITHVIM